MTRKVRIVRNDRELDDRANGMVFRSKVAALEIRCV